MQSNQKEMILKLQERCDIYSDLLENFVTNSIDIIKNDNTLEESKYKLSNLLFEIQPQIKKIENNITETKNIFNKLK